MFLKVHFPVEKTAIYLILPKIRSLFIYTTLQLLKGENMRKRLISMLLSLALMITSVNATVFAAEREIVDLAVTETQEMEENEEDKEGVHDTRTSSASELESEGSEESTIKDSVQNTESETEIKTQEDAPLEETIQDESSLDMGTQEKETLSLSETSLEESNNEKEEEIAQIRLTSEPLEEETTDTFEILADITMSGNGTDEDPYIITNSSQLMQIKLDLSANYVLANDLYLGTDAWEPIGDEENPFKGHFSGNDHVIYGLNGFKSDIRYRGLFGVASEESIIEYLGVEMDEDVEYKIKTGNEEWACTGLIVGEESGSIRYCYAKGRLLGRGQGLRDGGGPSTTGLICGWLYGNMSMCYSEGKAISSYEGFTSVGSAGTGGLCGRGNVASITDCYSICDLEGYASGYVSSNNYCGGIIGNGNGKTKVSRCYAISNVSGDHRVQACGIAGGATIDSCYYVVTYKRPQTSSPSQYDEGTYTNVKNEQAMKLASTYKGWDFKNTWVMGSDGYPKLKHFQKSNVTNDLSLVATNPTNNETQVPIDTDISLYFNKNVFYTQEDKIYVYDESGESVLYAVEHNGKRVIISLRNGLKDNEKYHVVFEEGAITARDEENNFEMYNSEIELYFTTCKNFSFDSGKYITIKEKNDISFPSNNVDEYVKELKYWAEQYEIEDVANADNLAEILNTKTYLPVKQLDSNSIYLSEREDTTLLDLMRDEIFIEEFQKNFESNWVAVSRADNFDDIKAGYEAYDSYSEQVLEYFEKNKRKDIFITWALPVFYQSFLTSIENKSGYKLAKPLLKISKIESYIDDEVIKPTQSAKTYDDYKENTEHIKVGIKGIQALWESTKYVLTGNGDISGSWIGFGTDMLSYKTKKSSNEWIKLIGTTLENFKDIKSGWEWVFFAGNTCGLVMLLPKLSDLLWDKLDEGVKTWYFISDYYISKNYPVLHDFVFDEEDMYPKDEMLNYGFKGGFEAYLISEGTPEQLKEAQEAESDKLLEWWMSWIEKNIRTEEHLREDNFQSRQYIFNYASIYRYMNIVDVNELKISIVKYASSIINEEDNTTVKVACPVTVNIYSKSDCELVSSISTENIEDYNDSPYFTVYTYGKNNETKCIVFSSEYYYIEIIPYSNGSMDVSVDFGNNNGYTYSNIEIVDGEPYYIESLGEELFEVIDSEGGLLVPDQNVYAGNIIINSDDIICNVGDEITLTATIYPQYANDSIIWEIEDQSCGLINEDGTFKALAIGETKIIARVSNNTNIYKEISVKILNLDFDTIAKNSTIYITKDDCVKLKIDGLSDRDIRTLSWYSKNPQIAVISKDGYIIGYKTGTAEITTEYKDVVITVTVIVDTAKCIVTFNYGYDDIIEVVDMLKSEKITLPENIKRDGYIFEGWYTEPNGMGEKISESSIVTESVVLYAYWKVVKEDETEDSSEIESESKTESESEKETSNTSDSEEESSTEPIIDEPITEPSTEESSEEPTTEQSTEEPTTEPKPENPSEEPSDTENQGDGLWVSGVNKSGYPYTGETIKPAIKVYDKTTLLTEKTDYTISYKNNTKAGKATITVSGKGNYFNKETVTFDILPVNIGSEEVHAMDFYVKIGNKAQKPVPELYYMGTKLKNNKDFTISYANTSNVYAQTGEYSVTITGQGNYTGARTLKLMAVEKIVKPKPISIAKATLNGFNKSFTYTGKACEQQCTLTIKTPDGVKTLIQGMDYTLQYTNNVKAGTATVTYYGKNEYTGKLKKTYKILPYNILDNCNAKIKYENNLNSVYAKGGSKPKPVVTFDGKALKEGVDYTISYKNNQAVVGNQASCVIVNGKGCFKGKIPINFTITSQDLSKMILVSGDKVYKNKANIYSIKPKLMDLNGKLLSAGKDFDPKSITYVYENDVVLENGISKKAGSSVEKTDIIPVDTQIRITLNCGSGGNYVGTFTGIYRIVKVDIKSAKVTIPKQIYTGNEITLDKSQITVKLSGVTLKPEDYEIIQYADNVKKGKASVTIKGKGNYGGVKTVKFTIGAKGFLWWWRK